MIFQLLGLDHVQLAMPEGGEPLARGFYATLLGMQEVPRPQVLAARGGCWFETGALRLHLGVERPFAPARKAHPGIEVDDLAALETRLATAGVTIRRDVALPGLERIHASDPFGNRLEFIEREPT